MLDCRRCLDVRQTQTLEVGLLAQVWQPNRLQRLLNLTGRWCFFDCRQACESHCEQPTEETAGSFSRVSETAELERCVLLLKNKLIVYVKCVLFVALSLSPPPQKNVFTNTDCVVCFRNV